MLQPSPIDAQVAACASALVPGDPPRALSAYDIDTFVHVVKRYGPGTEIRAYADAFTLVALVEGIEAIRIQLRPSTAINIVRGRSGQPLTPHRLAGAMRAVESWIDASPTKPIGRFCCGEAISSFVRVWTSDEWTVARVRSFDGGRYFEATAIDVVGEDEHIEHADLPGREVARVRFFDARQYHGYSELNFAFSYEARDGRLRTTYRLPHFRAQREDAFADVVEYVAGETGVKPLMLVTRSQPLDLDSERARFEAWYGPFGDVAPETFQLRDEVQDYVDPTLYTAFGAWKARAAAGGLA